MGSAKQTHAGAKAPNPFVERSDVNAPSAHMTNPLDEQLQLILSKKRSARCWSQASAVSKSHRDYVFTPPDVEERIRQTVGHSLSGCAIGQKATSSTDLASLQVLREREADIFQAYFLGGLKPLPTLPGIGLTTSGRGSVRSSA
ncbi:hypothetical protein ABG067_006881 [Albugo candida]|uniref:Uncharacterized protein n=1 Tax=Albugo candida TaxID=65357 RepID=A0A024FXR1_9STRA|nr:unnamed protein product [Albugo candida]|eukprot:CCI11439.1 unnamed protein product [Albugo candida]